jgi:hypothetical protein
MDIMAGDEELGGREVFDARMEMPCASAASHANDIRDLLFYTGVAYSAGIRPIPGDAL